MLSARTVQLATDVPCHPAKTPAPSTKNRRENVYQGAMTVHNGKAKNANLLRTPFQPKSAQPQRLSKDVHLKAPPIQLVVTHQPKPLADKTPFVNRVLNDYKTPGPTNQPLKPLNLKVPTDANPTPGSARASSARKHARLPKPQDYHDFQTPANVGNHWDISEDDIVIPEQMDETEKEVEEEPLDFNDEIEYMAPNTLNLEYQPPFDFDLPNYKLLGQDILHKFYSYPEEQTTLSPPPFEFTFKDEEFMKWDSLSLPSLSPSDDDDNPPSGTRTRRNSKQSQVTHKSSSTVRSVSVMTLRPKTTTPGSTREATRTSSSVTTKKPAGRNRSVSVMNLRSKTMTPASTRLTRPVSSISLKPPTNYTTGVAKQKTRTSTSPATTINTTSASSRMVSKPTTATTSGISTKTKPKQAPPTLANTKAPTSTKRGIHSISNIPRSSSTIKPILRPASSIGVNATTARVTSIATVKRPSTSISVTRPRSQPLTSSSTSSVQRGMKSSRATTVTSEKKSSTVSSGGNTTTCKTTTTKGRSASISMIKGKTLSSKNNNSATSSSHGSIGVGVALDSTVKKEKMDKDVISQFPVDAEIELKEDSDDDDDEDDEETIRPTAPLNKPSTQDDINNTTTTTTTTTPLEKKETTTTKQYPKDSNVEQGQESNLSTVEEVTEVSISLDIVEKMEVLMLE